MTAALIAFRADLSAPDRPVSQVRRAIERVLARPEYRHPAPSILGRLRNDAFDWVARALAHVVGSGIGAWIAVAVIAALVSLVVWRLGSGVTRDPGGVVAVAGRRDRPAAAWRAEAEAHERSGEWRQAVRCRYRALVADLADRGLLHEIPGRTAGEYRSVLGASLPVAASTFLGVTELFEGAWYGGRPTAAADAAHFRDLADRVLEAAT